MHVPLCKTYPSEHIISQFVAPISKFVRPGQVTHASVPVVCLYFPATQEVQDDDDDVHSYPPWH